VACFIRERDTGVVGERKVTAEQQRGESGEVLLYQGTDGGPALDVRLQRETVWLTQAQLAELFGRERSVVTKHVNNVFKEGELEEKSNVQILHIAGSDKPVTFYNLDVIISVGYRVKSKRGTQFRIWATNVLRQHLVRGYTVHERRLKELNQAVRLIADVAHGARSPATTRWPCSSPKADPRRRTFCAGWW
jgi:hypothetical protein